ncbi:ABC-three component system protein [Paenibacillus thiaminolyticus]|uniref:ABC-three component system protein n=1 Tax=Paenibacillus thiaminolyticus TaxID=49283 RepID=UPI003D2CE4EB
MTLGSRVHTAAGSMAGYLFQPERALYWLANSRNGSQIGIEAEDDIVVKAKNEDIIVREQDKHATSENIPFGDHSKDLWNTLSIWCKAIKAKEVNLSETKFFMVTNKIVKNGLATLINKANDENQAKECVVTLKELIPKIPQSVQRYAREVAESNESDLCLLIQNIELCDGSNNSYGDGLKEEIQSLLLVPEELPFDEIYNSLLGWIHECALNCWREKQLAWLKRDNFVKYYHRLIQRHKIKPFVETAKSLITVTSDERNQHRNDIFVKQMELISFENHELIEAINDYLCCKAERTRFSVAGNLTKQDFLDFERKLTERWELIFLANQKRYKVKKRNCEDIFSLGEEMGLNVFEDTLNHREKLAGYPTEEFYLTRGTYHHLSNRMTVGWHPEYNNLIKTNSEEN